MSAAFSRVKQHVLNLGEAGKKVKRDFEVMEVSVARGLKGIAVSAFLIRKELTGIKAAGSMEEAMLKVETNLASGAANAAALKRQLGEVRATAIEVSKAAPFSAEEVVNIENALLKAGVALDNISGKGGAAWAATALATLSDEAPDLIGESLARIGSMFNLEGSQYGDMADWLSRVDEASSTNIPELIQGLRMAGATAKGLGIPAKDAVTALGALAPLGGAGGILPQHDAGGNDRKDQGTVEIDEVSGSGFLR